MSSAIAQLAAAYMQRERARLGIVKDEQDADENSRRNLLVRAQAAKIAQDMDFAPAEQDRSARLTEAQIRNLDEPNHNPSPAAKTVERTVDYGDRIRTFFIDGTTKDEPKGAAPKAHGSGDDGGAAANPFNVTLANGDVRMAVRDKSAPGGLRFVDNIGGTPVNPGPTADMRNNDYQSQSVGPAFELVKQSLSSLKTAMGKSWDGGMVSGIVPSTDVNFAKTRFQDQAKALLGAIVARMAGEGSRLSDDDRKAYSQASTLVNNAILMPGGIEEAEARLGDAERLIGDILTRRHGGAAPPADGGPGAGAPRRIKYDAQGNRIQ